MTSLFNFLLVLQGFVAAGLVGLVLMQRSEGGGLGIGGGGSPGGLMSARGAADFLTRATKWFAVVFVVLAIVLASIATNAAGQGDLDDSLDRTTATSDIDGTPADGAAQGDGLFPADTGLDGAPPVETTPAPDGSSQDRADSTGLTEDPLANIGE
ncbi:preprotein translocase subunit SecG [Erythrobacter arachoides]|uniref:Protein-export membrane protein SecG n=1 Tax=Aurantiacibacter arachoides TaxID=1850444 RepID=A0A844ZZG4_9SPHN|nr:preprotein translocase subunit SecG [Aurantiacibacter arachoides]MXO93108.1 preprotein translocase subunit SecG [Aurantiacibacter arachoides]GGD51981.1 preprotein translocase subunit SecG [Aurantiacibacter arachoides]